MCCKQRWTSNPMRIVGILIFPQCLLVLRYCQKRSGPLTPHVNCFHCVSETEWCGEESFFQELSSRMQLQLHPVCKLVPVGPWTHRSTDTQQSDSEKQLPLSSFQPQISEPDMTRLSFRQLSLFVIWRPGFLETSIEFISCVCWGNTEDLSSLKEVKQPYNTEPCCLTPVLALKIFGKSQTSP